jgi:hypothetical protein
MRRKFEWLNGVVSILLPPFPCHRLAWQRNGGKGISIDGDALDYNSSRLFGLVIFAADRLKMSKAKAPECARPRAQHTLEP